MINKKTKWILIVIASCLCLILAIPLLMKKNSSFTALSSKPSTSLEQSQLSNQTNSSNQTDSSNPIDSTNTTIDELETTSPSFTALLSILGSKGSKFEGQLQPINIVNEDSGIKMEVIGAMNDDDAVYIYISLQDLIGNRIDKSLQIFNYEVKCNGVYLNTFPLTTKVLTYDEATYTAIMQLFATTDGTGIDTLNGKKITVHFDELPGVIQKSDDTDIKINLGEISDKVNTVEIDKNYISTVVVADVYSYYELQSKLDNGQTINILKPNELHIPIPGNNFIYISNIGIVDGKLHVQLCKNYIKSSAMYTNGNLALTTDSPDAVKDNYYYSVDGYDFVQLPYNEIIFHLDEKGNIQKNTVNLDNMVYIRGNGESNINPDYSEVIYTASPDILSNCKLKALGFININYAPCNLQATFEVNALKESKSTKCNIDLGVINLNEIDLSPFGITILGNEDESYSLNMDISVTMADGLVEKLSSFLIERSNGISSYSLIDDPNPKIISVPPNHGPNGEFSIKLINNEPIDYEKIVSIIINGNTVDLK